MGWKARRADLPPRPGGGHACDARAPLGSQSPRPRAYAAAYRSMGGRSEELRDVTRGKETKEPEAGKQTEVQDTGRMLPDPGRQSKELRNVLVQCFPNSNAHNNVS